MVVMVEVAKDGFVIVAVLVGAHVDISSVRSNDLNALPQITLLIHCAVSNSIYSMYCTWNTTFHQHFIYCHNGSPHFFTTTRLKCE